MSEAAKAEFEQHCGPDCKYVDCEVFNGGNRFEIGYEVPTLNRFFVVGVNTSDVNEAARKAGQVAKAKAALKIAEAEAK